MSQPPLTPGSGYRDTFAGNLNVQLASDRVKRDREWVLLTASEARNVAALVEAIDRLVLVYDLDVDPAPILAGWQALKERRAALEADRG